MMVVGGSWRRGRPVAPSSIDRRSRTALVVAAAGSCRGDSGSRDSAEPAATVADAADDDGGAAVVAAVAAGEKNCSAVGPFGVRAQAERRPPFVVGSKEAR